MSRTRASAQTIALPWTQPPLSLNDRLHWRTKAALTKTIRNVVSATACVVHLSPIEGHATVTLHYQPADNRRRDADNLYATVKPCLDGLRDARIIRDDSADLVTPLVRIHQAIKGEPARMWLEIVGDEPPCAHEWMTFGDEDATWRECWLCGRTEW